MCGWHAAALRPAAGRAWLGAAMEPAGSQLAPLASAVLSLQPRDARAQAGWASLRLSAAPASASAAASVGTSELVEATALTPQELALAAKLEAACRAADAEDGRYEGSGDWARATLHSYFAGMAQYTSSQILAGSAAELQAVYG